MVIFLAALVLLQSPLVTMEQANSAYLAEDYTTAIRLYESLVDTGVRHEHVYFNLGSAHYGSGELGRGLVYFLRVQRSLPRDRDLSLAISQIRSERLDVQGDERAVLDNLTSFSTAIVTNQELALAAFIVWSLCFLFGLWMLLRPQWREVLRAPLIVISVVCLALLSLLVGRLYVEEFRPRAVVVGAPAPVLTGPAETYLEIFELNPAAEVRIVEQRQEWVRFVLPDGRQGWMLAASVMIV